MAKRGRRYNDGAKLNMKKVFAVIIAFLLIIALIVGIKKLLTTNSKSIAGKIETVHYYTIYDNGKWGVINSYGDVIVKPEYDEMIVIPESSQDVFICIYDADYAKGTYKTKVINSKGKEIIKDYDKIEAVANYDEDHNIWYEKNVFKAQKNGKYGLVNYSGKKLLECEYDSINPINGIENSIIIEKNGVVGICDDSGNIIIEPKYKSIEKIGNDYKNGYIVINSENKYGIIGFDKERILEEKFEEIKGIVGEDIYAVKENGKYSFIDKSEQKKTNKQFKDVLEINKENAVVMNDSGKYGVIDINNGETKVDFKYDKLQYTSNNNYIAKNGDKYGIISIDGTEKLKFESTNVRFVNSGNLTITDYSENRKYNFKSI